MRISDWSSDVCSSDLPLPLKALGRFRHEAAAVDPRTGIVYLTEDRDDGLFYRLLPERKGRLAAGGRFQVLAFSERERGRDARNWGDDYPFASRSEEHTSELQSLKRISYAVFCLQKQIHTTTRCHLVLNTTHKQNLIH